MYRGFVLAAVALGLDPGLGTIYCAPPPILFPVIFWDCSINRKAKKILTKKTSETAFYFFQKDVTCCFLPAQGSWRRSSCLRLWRGTASTASTTSSSPAQRLRRDPPPARVELRQLKPACRTSWTESPWASRRGRWTVTHQDQSEC